MYKILWDSEIQTDHQVAARKLDIELNNKENTCHLMNFAVPADHRLKMKESKEIDKDLDLARELKKGCGI